MELQLEHHSLPNGKQYEFIVVDAPDWSIIVPELDYRLVMIEQYRPAWRSMSIEFPGGRLHKDEDILMGANRELEEETGYTSKKLVLHSSARPVSWTTQSMHICFAGDLEYIGQNLDDEEDIRVIEVTPDQVKEMITTGEITQAATIHAFYRWRLHRGD